MKQTLLDYYRRYLDHFATNLEKARTDLDEEAIHQYRVSIKRIMSISRACKKVCNGPGFDEDQLAAIKKIFKAGGSIRDQQIQLGIIRKTELKKGLAFPYVENEIVRSIEKQKKYFKLATDDHDPLLANRLFRRIEENVETMDEEVLRAGIHDWISRVYIKLRTKKDKLSNAADLHNYRTRFKQAAYLLEMIQESRLEEEKVPKYTYDRLKNFGQELGDWHDYYMMLQRLSTLSRDAQHDTDRSECSTLLDFIMPLQEAYYSDVIVELRKGRIFEGL